MISYDLGGIGRKRNGRTTVNLSSECDVRHDFVDLDGFIADDGIVDEFLLSHALEHVPAHLYSEFLRGLYRKLRVGGNVTVVQTDAGGVIKQWLTGRLSFRAMRATIFPPASRVDANPLNLHHNMWTTDQLARDFKAIGFQAESFDAGTWPFDVTDELFPEDCVQFHGISDR